MLLTKVTSAMKTRTQLDERSFEQLLAAAYQLQQQQQREPLPFPSARQAAVSAFRSAGNRALSPALYESAFRDPTADASAVHDPAIHDPAILAPAINDPALNGQRGNRNEDQRLSALAEAHAIVHGKQLDLQQTLRFVLERALSITGGAGAAIWLIRGSNAVCQAARGTSAGNVQQSISIEGSRLTSCLRRGEIFRCTDAASDPRTRYDALPGNALGSLLAVPIHYDGGVQGSLEVTFANAWGFGESEVRTCQILSGLVTETVASEIRSHLLESERATLLDAIDRLQPHLSRLLDDSITGSTAQPLRASAVDDDIDDDAELPTVGLPPAPAGPTHGLARLGKYLLDQQAHGDSSSLEMEHPGGKSAPREVHTALNLSVASQRAPADFRTGSSISTGEDSVAFDEFEAEDSDSFGPRTHALVPAPVRTRSSSLSPAYERWHEAEVEAEVEPDVEADVELTTAAEPQVSPTFWQSHGANLCLAASAILFVAALTWALWPRPAKPHTPVTANAAAPAEPKLSTFEQLLVDMGIAEAPPVPVVYTGTPGTRVWVDLNNALYYCPGAVPYGTTPKGKFLTQRDAQVEQFQPARGQPCE